MIQCLLFVLFNYFSKIPILSMKTLLPLIAALCLCGACSRCASKEDAKTEAYSENRSRMEKEAQVRLAQARSLLAAGRQGEAKVVVEQMRKDCYLALDARVEGILLMDSIDLQLARVELARTDSLLRAGCDTLEQADFDEACRKVQFYERKIQHDRSRQ